MPYVVFLYGPSDDAITFRGWLEERPRLRSLMTRVPLPPEFLVDCAPVTTAGDAFSLWDDAREVAPDAFQPIRTAFNELPGSMRNQVGVGNTIEEALQDVPLHQPRPRPSLQPNANGDVFSSLRTRFPAPGEVIRPDPIRRNIDYTAVGRRTFLVDDLETAFDAHQQGHMSTEAFMEPVVRDGDGLGGQRLDVSMGARVEGSRPSEALPLDPETRQRIITQYIQSQSGRTELAQSLRNRGDLDRWARETFPVQQMPEGAQPTFGVVERGDITPMELSLVSEGGEPIQRPDADQEQRFSGTVTSTGVFDINVPDHLRDSITVGQHVPELGGTVLQISREGPSFQARVEVRPGSEDPSTFATQPPEWAQQPSESDEAYHDRVRALLDDAARVLDASQPPRPPPDPRHGGTRLPSMAQIAQRTRAQLMALDDQRVFDAIDRVAENFEFRTGHPRNLRLPDRYPDWCVMGAWLHHKDAGIFGQVIDAEEVHQPFVPSRVVIEPWSESRSVPGAELGSGTSTTPEGNYLVSAADVIGRWEPWNEDRLPKTFWELLDEDAD